MVYKRSRLDEIAFQKQFEEALNLAMHHIGDGMFEVDYRIDAAGAYGLTVRVLPRHDGLLTPVELGRATWAS
jgi:hypothetical protein